MYEKRRATNTHTFISVLNIYTLYYDFYLDVEALPSENGSAVPTRHMMVVVTYTYNMHTTPKTVIL